MSTVVAGTGWRKMVSARPVARTAPLAVLDLGTSKMCCFIARPRPSRGFALIGRGYQVADGLRAGEIVDAEAVDASLRAVLHEAEEQAGETLREIVVTLSGGAPRSTHVRVSSSLGGRSVSQDDLRRLMRRAHDEVEGEQRAVAHVLPLEVTIDGGRPLRDPRGMSGQRLEMLAHVVSVRAHMLRDVLAALTRCHLVIKGVAVASYAAGFGCLTEDELERGCLRARHGRRHHRHRPFRRRPPGAGRPGPLWRRPCDRRPGLRPVDQPRPCRADQEPLWQRAVARLRRQSADPGAADRRSRPACRPARFRAPG